MVAAGMATTELRKTAKRNGAHSLARPVVAVPETVAAVPTRLRKSVAAVPENVDAVPKLCVS